MNNWVPFAEGEYLVDHAYLVAPSGNATALENVIVEVCETVSGRRTLSATARVFNTLLVDLMEEGDEIDMIFDFGEEFKYLLPVPTLESGKVFTPGVRSSMKIFPRQPWRQLPRREYEDRLKRMTVLTPAQDE